MATSTSAVTACMEVAAAEFKLFLRLSVGRRPQASWTPTLHPRSVALLADKSYALDANDFPGNIVLLLLLGCCRVWRVGNCRQAHLRNVISDLPDDRCLSAPVFFPPFFGVFNLRRLVRQRTREIWSVSACGCFEIEKYDVRHIF